MKPLRIFFILFFVFLQFTFDYEFYNHVVGGAYLNGSLPSILLIGLCLAAANFYMAVVIVQLVKEKR